MIDLQFEHDKMERELANFMCFRQNSNEQNNMN
jgi:hypothetical protein